MIVSIIGTLIVGAVVGYGGRLVLPGAQDIGAIKTVALGVISAFVVGLILGSISSILAIIVGTLVAAGLLWFSIRQGWLTA